jgi:hypothetical protein
VMAPTVRWPEGPEQVVCSAEQADMGRYAGMRELCGSDRTCAAEAQRAPRRWRCDGTCTAARDQLGAGAAGLSDNWRACFCVVYV